MDEEDGYERKEKRKETNTKVQERVCGKEKEKSNGMKKRICEGEPILVFKEVKQK